MTVPTFELQPTIDDAGRLIGHDGALHSRLTWRSPLERKLTFATRFPARAHRITAAFERRFLPERVSGAELAELEGWLLEVAPYLGSPAIDHAGELPRLRPALAELCAREATALARFLDDVADPPPPRRERPPGKRRVVVFFGDLGGGTRTAAEAIAELLRETEDMEPVLLSAHSDVQGPESSFFRAFGVSEADAWNRGLADGGDMAVIERCRAARGVLRRYFVPAGVADAAHLISEHHPSHVLSLLPGYPLLAQIASEEAPVTLLHADHGLNASLSGEETGRAAAPYRLLDPGRVTIGLSSEQPEPALDRMRAVIGARLDRLVRVIGLPVRRAFSRPRSAGELASIRAALGVAPEERVVLLMMGQDGMGDRMVGLVRQLLEVAPGSAPPLHLVAVCGRSERSRAAIEGVIASSRRPLRSRVTGMLPAEELAGYMHLAARPGPERGGVVVSKPGGATTAECAAAGAHMLLCPGLPWEEKNHKAAIDGGFGEGFPEEGFVPALARALAETPVRVPQPVDWRARLLAHLRTIPAEVSRAAGGAAGEREADS